MKDRITFEEKIDETIRCAHDFACLYGCSECVGCSIDSVDGDNILFLKEKGPRFCPYRLLWGHSEICRCPTRYGMATSFPTWEQRKKNVGFWKADKNHIITDANECAEGILGVLRDQIVGARCVADPPAETIRHFLPFYHRAIQTRKTVRFENIPTANSARIPTNHSGWMIPRFRDREIAHIICIFEDTP